MALSILYWANYVEGLTKIKRKSEAAVESQRVLRFAFDELRVITANVQASMRDTSYKVQIFLEVWWSHHHASVLWGGISVIMWQQLSFMDIRRQAKPT